MPHAVLRSGLGSRGRIWSLLVGVCAAAHLLDARADHPPGFVESDIVRPDGNPWNEAVGLTFSSAGRLFVWERGGRVWIVDEQAPVTTPFLDISDEVGAWDDHGMLGFALDPEFETTGYVYAFYVVDSHHLFNCVEPASGSGAAQCGPAYDPAVDQYFEATIGRLTRYRALLPPAASDYRNAQAIDPASRKVLIGETAATGLPITHATHGVGSLVFGTDGTLLLGTGDGAWAENDVGSDPNSNFQQALDAGIIRPEENVGAYRSQLVDSLNGKILRIDPATGDGLASNPFFDPSAPRAARSRVWALGMRNPFRMVLRPGTGDHDPAAGAPGVLLVGNVGYRSWEELEIVDAPGQNFGWPIFEGLEPTVGYDDGSTENRDAPNPLFDVGGCTQQFFRFTDLLRQDSLPPATFFPNPCDASQPVPSGVPVFVHRRPALDWGDAGPARVGVFVNGEAATIAIDDPASPVRGSFFGGASSVAGVWYQGDDFPAEYRNTYFHGDYVGQWIRNLRFDAQGVLTDVVDFTDAAGGVVAMASHPTRGGLYFISWTAFVKRLDYAPGGNFAPTAAIVADRAYGSNPLTVQFDASGSADREGPIVSYLWDFGDGSLPGSGLRPSHTFTAASAAPESFTVRLTVTDAAGATGEATFNVALNNTPPAVTILSPVNGSVYRLTADTAYQLIADIRDAEQSAEQLGCRWEVVLHHNTHQHSQPPDTRCASSVVLQAIGCDGDSYYYSVRLTVTDAVGSSASDESVLMPFCGPGNMPPVANGDLAPVRAGQTVSIPVLANDVDDVGLDPASVRIASLPGVGSIAAVDPVSGAITYRHDGASGEFVTFSYTVADRTGARSNAAIVRIEIERAGASGNRPPVVVTKIGDREFSEGSLVGLDVASFFDDPDGDVLTFSAVGLPATLAFSAEGVVSGTVTAADIPASPYTIRVTARDPSGLAASGVFSLDVLPSTGASLSTSVTVAPKPALRGETTRWRITVRNAGPELASAVALTGRLHGDAVNWTAVGTSACSFDRSASPPTFGCALGDLRVAESRVVELEATAAATDIVLLAGAVTTTSEANPSDNNAGAELNVAERFSLGPAQVLGKADARAVALGDVNGDGWPDAVLATTDGQPTEVYFNRGTGALRVTPVTLPPDDSYDIALADLDRDGDLDLVLATATGGRVLFNAGAGAFVSRVVLGAAATRAVAAVDLDGDADADLAFAAQGGHEVYVNDGFGAFTLAARLGSADGADVAAADVDGDGRPDLVFANRDGADTLYRNQTAAGVMAWGAPSALPSAASAALAVADYDRNGSPDLVLGTALGRNSRELPARWLLRNDGGGRFSAAQRLGLTSTRALETGDPDRDARVDWWVASGGGAIQRYVDQGGTLALAAEQLAVGEALGLARGDIDRDGSDDLLVVGSPGGGAQVFLNDGTGGIGRRDRTPPVIALLGAAGVTVQSGVAYVDAGATATDDFDGNLTSRLVVDNPVNTSVAGVYRVTYTVSDFSGNRASASRAVTVVAGGSGGGGGGGSALSLLVLASVAAMLRRRDR